MKAQHTPGPLRVVNDEPRRIKIVDVNGEIIFSESRHAFSSSDVTAEDAMQAQGFTFPNADREGAIEANRRQLADAYLRAAAPELLAALESLADYLEERSGDNECRPLENARDVIAKARGEA